MKKILFTFLLLGWIGNLMAQTIQRIEYFLDSDPGIGNGVNVAFSGTNIATASLNVPINSGITDGFHKFFVRAKDSNGRWSLAQSQNFFKVNIGNTPSNIVKLEYYIDTDPGFGLANNLSVTSGQSITKEFSIPLLANLPLGFHKIYMRAKDASGKWSTVFQQNFFKSNFVTSTNNITKLEYFIDTDPGFGLGINIPITANQSVTKELNIALASNVPLGFHKFYIRAKDASGKWSVVFQQNFFKTDLSLAIPNLIKLEYFVNTDPGFGNGTDIPVGNHPIYSSNQVFSLINSLPLGNHSLTIRGKDTEGHWSVVGTKIFKNCPGLSISAPLGLVSCNDSLTFTSTKNHPELGGTINWYRNGNLLPQTTDNMVTYNSGVFKAALSTPGCSNVFSNELSVNVAGSISLNLKTPKLITFCNESQAISIDSALSVFPIGVSAVFDWYKNDTLILSNSPLPTFSVNTPGKYKASLKVSSFPAECQVFDTDSVTIQNQNLTLQIGPETTPGNIVLCPGSIFSLSAVSNIQETPAFQWFKDGNPIAGQTANTTNISSGGLFVVKGSIGACLDIISNSILATVTDQLNNDVPELSSDKNLSQTYCYEEVITFTATGCSNGVLWTPFLTPISSTQATYVVGGNYQFSVSCKGSCTGQQSNTLSVTAAGYYGRTGAIEFAMASLPADYQKVITYDYIDTYDGAKVTGRKNLVGGGSLTFGTNTNVIWENYNKGVPEVSNGMEDFFIRYNHGLGGYGKYYYLGGSQSEYLNGYIETDPGQFLMYGQSASPISGSVSQASFGIHDFWIVKFDIATATKMYDKKFGGTDIDVATTGVELNNGQLLIGGYSSSGANGNKTTANFGSEDYWIVKTDANGNKLADFSYGGTGSDKLIKILKINEDLFVLFGTSNSPVSGNKSMANYNASNDFWVVWINANGVIQQQKTYGGSLDEQAVQAMISASGDLYFCGSSNSNITNDKTQVSRGQYDFWVIKTNQTGQKIWDKTLGGGLNDFMTAANFTLDEHLVFFGTTSSLTPSFERHMVGFQDTFGSTDAWVIEIDTSGNFVTDYILGSCGDDEGSAILELTPKGEIEAMVHIERLPSFSGCSKEYFGIGAVGIQFPRFFVMEKANFQKSRILCKNTPVYLRVNFGGASADNINYGKEILWSNGQTLPIFKTILSDSLEISSKVKLLKAPCFSLSSYFSLPVYPNLIQKTGTISSPFQTKINREFAYEKVKSTEKILERHNTNYISEKAIELSPGFEIKGGNFNVFKAEIAGCVNN